MDGMTLVCLLYQVLDVEVITPEAIRAFCNEIGVAKADSTVDSRLIRSLLKRRLTTKSSSCYGSFKTFKISYN